MNNPNYGPGRPLPGSVDWAAFRIQRLLEEEEMRRHTSPHHIEYRSHPHLKAIHDTASSVQTASYADTGAQTTADQQNEPAADARVIVSEPTGWGSSSLGHAAFDIDGTTYSFGPAGMKVLPTAEYTERNGFRDNFGLRPSLSPDQVNRVRQCLARPQESYEWLDNNCTDPIERCLAAAGIDVGDSWTPTGLGMSLLQYLQPGGVDCYSQSRPASGTKAPWAK